MLFFNMPPNGERYVAELNNLLEFETRPLCIRGTPRVHIWELRKQLNGRKNDKNSFIVKNSKITLHQNFTLIEKNP